MFVCYRPTRLCVVVIMFFSHLVCSCVTYNSLTSSVSKLYLDQQYDQAIELLDTSDIYKQNKNKLLYLLEKATVLYAKGALKESRSLFVQADKLSDLLYTQSIKQHVQAFFYNDTAINYGGEDYEKIALHIMMGLSFLKHQDIGSALIEARKINNKLSEFLTRYTSTVYKEDAFARFLSGLVYEAQGNYDDAIIDYRKAFALYHAGFFQVKIPDFVVEALYTVASKRSRSDIISKLKKHYPGIVQNIQSRSGKYGYLVTIRTNGLIAHKESKTFVTRVNGAHVSYSFPIIKQTFEARNNQMPVKIDKNIIKSDTLVQDMNTIAWITLEEKRLRLLAKGALKALVKAQISHEVRKSDEDLADILDITSVLLDRADTRSWHLCPASFYVSRTPLLPGTHTVLFAGKPKTVNIEADRIYFLVE